MLSAGDTDVHVALIAAWPGFKITFGMSGTFLEQAELYQTEVIAALQELHAAGKENGQVEFLDETYYHSLTSLFEDPHKTEFREQFSLHREKMGSCSASFRPRTGTRN